MTAGRRAALAAVVVLAAAAPARAHLTSTGLGPFYDGLVHPFLTAEDVLAVLAVSLFAGMRGADAGRWTMFALPAAWTLGMAAAWLPDAVAAADERHGAVAIPTLATGILVAADARLGSRWVALVATAVGLVHGRLDGEGFRAAGAGATAVAGTACAVFAVAAIVAGQTAAIRSPRGRIVFRVAGAWIAAIALLMLGWALRG